MNHTALDIKVLTNPSTFNNDKHVYTVVSISGRSGKVQKIKTTWNKPIKFKVNEAECVRNEVTLVVKIKAKRMFVDKKLGEVSVMVKELMEGVATEGKSTTVSYPVKGRLGESKGDITFCYEFGKLVSGEGKKLVIACPSQKAVSSSSLGYPPGKARGGGGIRKKRSSSLGYPLVAVGGGIGQKGSSSLENGNDSLVGMLAVVTANNGGGCGGGL
ncbi:protein SRC2-like [Bidens hawaiensis]|uniref:protein SRC2-like n=1 Tax=Bidens hawaiensis TaxID=980011 RepID=UPI00404AC4D3